MAYCLMLSTCLVVEIIQLHTHERFNMNVIEFGQLTSCVYINFVNTSSHLCFRVYRVIQSFFAFADPPSPYVKVKVIETSIRVYVMHTSTIMSNSIDIAEMLSDILLL